MNTIQGYAQSSPHKQSIYSFMVRGPEDLMLSQDGRIFNYKPIVPQTPKIKSDEQKQEQAWSQPYYLSWMISTSQLIHLAGLKQSATTTLSHNSARSWTCCSGEKWGTLPCTIEAEGQKVKQFFIYCRIQDSALQAHGNFNLTQKSKCKFDHIKRMCIISTPLSIH